MSLAEDKTNLFDTLYEDENEDVGDTCTSEKQTDEMEEQSINKLNHILENMNVSKDQV